MRPVPCPLIQGVPDQRRLFWTRKSSIRPGLGSKQVLRHPLFGKGRQGFFGGNFRNASIFVFKTFSRQSLILIKLLDGAFDRFRFFQKVVFLILCFFGGEGGNTHNRGCHLVVPTVVYVVSCTRIYFCAIILLLCY